MTELQPMRFIPGVNTPPEVSREQLRINIQRDIPWLKQEAVKDRPLSIVAGGPSLAWRWPEISGDVLALNNTYSFLVDRGIYIDYWMLLDCREDNVAFLENPQQNVKHYVAAQCHPSVFDRLAEFDTTLYLTTLPDTLELTKHVEKPKVQLSGTVGTVGIKAMALAYALGYRKMILYGYDSSYLGDEHHAYKQTLNDEAKTHEVFICGQRYVTTPTLAHQASEFPGWAQSLVANFGCDIELRCHGLLPDTLAAANARGLLPIEAREREKYQKVWEHDSYRKKAHEHHVMLAIKALEMEPGDSVIDFGCGTGRGAQKFKNLGFDVTAVDIAGNCRDRDVDVKFIEACLWDMPAIKAKFGYCTDVMEHIPREKVIDVIRGIADRCESAYFNIATTDDAWDRLAGYKLHQTVLFAESWLEVLQKFWDVSMASSDDDAVFVCKPKEQHA